MSAKRSFLLGMLVSTLGCLPASVFGAMTSTNFQVPWDAIGTGGDEQGSSTSYRVDDTVGGTAVGMGTSTSFALMAGYRDGDARGLSFFARMAPPGSGIPYVSISALAGTLTLASAPGGSLSVGDYIVIIENPGLSQLTATARVGAITGSGISVDQFDGQIGSMSASPSNGRVMLASGGSISLGELSAASGGVGTGMLSVQAGSSLGYALYAQAVAPLASTAGTFASVSDGAVSAGTEEYGMRTYGARADLSADTAIQTVPTLVQSSTAASSATGDRTAFLYKIAIGSSTAAGAYSQALVFTLTANY